MSSVWTAPKHVVDLRTFTALPLEKRVRNTCPGCGCRLIVDYGRAIEFVNGPPRRGRCQKCGWVGTK